MSRSARTNVGDPTRPRLLAAAVVFVAVLEGAMSAARTGPPTATAATPEFVRGARWFPVVDDPDPRLTMSEPDGSVRVVERGLRLVEHPDGRIERAADLLPADGPLAALELPARFGGGFLFSVNDRGTRLWRAQSWTARLAPLTRLPFESTSIVAGFDRLYASSASTHALVGVDPATGALVGGGALPDAPAYGGAAFADAWMGAVEVDIRGGLVTFDAGASFHPVRVPLVTPGVFEQGGRVVLGTNDGAFALSPSGELERLDGPTADAVFDDLRPVPSPDSEDDDVPLTSGHPRENVLGGRSLEVVALRGLPDSSTTAVVVANGVLARVDLIDGKILAVDAHAVPPGSDCEAIRLFSGLGFVCGEDRGGTSVYALHVPLTLAPVLAYPAPRVVLSGGTGSIAVRGGCPGSVRDDSTYCIVPASGPRREIRVMGNPGVERVVPLGDGRVVVIVPPGRGRSGAITVVPVSGPLEVHPLSLDAVPSDEKRLVERGSWLDGVVERDTGKLSAWIAGSEPFLGVQIGLGGSVVAGPARTGVDRASFCGELAFVTDDRGGGSESTDGGQTWSDADLPASADPDEASSVHERGCTRVGASIGSWVRIGWGKAVGSPALALAAEPPMVKMPPAPFVTWAFECAATGEEETSAKVAAENGGPRPPPESPASAARPSSSAVQELETSAFRPFLGMPSPPLLATDLGFDFGTEDQIVEARGYAWGARDGEWDRVGRWQVRVADRFRVKHSIWSTAPSRSPWADAASAAEVFGSEPSHRISNEWNALVDPVEDAGVLLMRTGSAVQLVAIERDRAMVVAENTEQFSLDRIVSAVKVRDRFYLGSVPGPRSLDILSFDHGELATLGSYPRFSDPRYAESDARVVRTARGDGLGIWVIGRGQFGTAGGGDTWFVYPVDPATGYAGRPTVVHRDVLAHSPRPCDLDADGWVLTYDVSPSVGRIDFTNTRENPSIGRVEARLLLNDDGLCLDSLAAQVDGDPPKRLEPTAASSNTHRGAELTLTDRATDHRWGFRCSP